jgi:muconate cycloisomerase
MIVKRVDIWRLRLPFHFPFKHTLATHAASENLVVKVTTDSGSAGYGEGVPRAFVTGETLTGALSFLTETLGPMMLGASFASPEELMQELARLPGNMGAEPFPGAWCALEMALLDAAGRAWSSSLSDFLGGIRQKSVCYSAVVPMAELAQLPRFFQLVKAKGMRFLKLKVGEADDLKVLELARKELGRQIDIRVDANGAWSAEEAVASIKDMLPYRISAVEQPVAKEDFAGLASVSRALTIPVIADESLCSEADARKLIDLKACRMFNIRLSKCGGLNAAIRIRTMAEAAGIACQLGCHVGETSILAAAGRHFALCSDHLTYVEGSFAPYLLAKDPVAPSVVFGEGGVAPPLPGPGLGITVREDVLADLAVSHVSLP